MDTTSINSAVAILGSQTQLAKQLGISQSMVWRWCAGLSQVAAHHCRGIEALTHGAVTRFDLRPDIFGPSPLRRTAAA